MPNKASFPQTTFTDAGGNPLSNGYLLIRLSADAQAPDSSQIASQRVMRVALDANGVITGGPEFWPNSEMNPSSTVYLLSVFRQNGQKLISDLPVTVVGVSEGFGLAFGTSFAS